MEIQFVKPSMKPKSGQWLFINVPDVSRTQWHPFTITSCPYDPYISIHVRQLGDWTRALGDALGCGEAQAKEFEALELEAPDQRHEWEIALQEGQHLPKIRIDGPYGAPAEDVFENEIAILIGAGIGVTPWASILKNIWHKRDTPAMRRLQRVEFIWTTREIGSFEWFQALLYSLEQQSLNAAAMQGEQGKEFLKIHTYLTGKLNLNEQQNIIYNSVGADSDPLTELQTRTNFGRPNFKRLFAAIRDGIVDGTYFHGLAPNKHTQTKHSRTTVGVYFCGPAPAAREIKKACNIVKCNEVDFKFWKEHF
jgi:NADPH oxidase